MTKSVYCLIPSFEVQGKSSYRNWLIPSIECLVATRTYDRIRMLREYTKRVLEVLVAGLPWVLRLAVASRSSVRMVQQQSLWPRPLWGHKTYQISRTRRLKICRRPASLSSARSRIISVRAEVHATESSQRTALLKLYKNLSSDGLIGTQITSLIKSARAKIMADLMNFKVRRLMRLCTSFVKRHWNRCTKRCCWIYWWNLPFQTCSHLRLASRLTSADKVATISRILLKHALRANSMKLSPFITSLCHLWMLSSSPLSITYQVKACK